jgi:toxin-antitoxin system PIN domain toxin
LSTTLDANVLVYAANRDDPLHERAEALVRRLAAGPEIVYLFWPTLLGFLRLVTHPSILSRPMAARDAERNIEALIDRPHVRAPGEDEGFWQFYRSAAGDHARGNEVPDAHLAALMRQHGVRLIYTRDRGFRRFDGIDARDPFA